ncbi:hypothetical protein TURU_059447 [Turdus rufiventris]|nr:hypothetical protein TURU_059447 [Turdus rufiventris]
MSWRTSFLLDAVCNVGNIFRVGIWTWTSRHSWVCDHQAMGLIQSYSFDVSNKRQHLYKEHIDKWRRQASGLEKTSASNILMYLEDLRLEMEVCLLTPSRVPLPVKDIVQLLSTSLYPSQSCNDVMNRCESSTRLENLSEMIEPNDSPTLPPQGHVTKCHTYVVVKSFVGTGTPPLPWTTLLKDLIFISTIPTQGNDTSKDQVTCLLLAEQQHGKMSCSELNAKTEPEGLGRGGATLKPGIVSQTLFLSGLEEDWDVPMAEGTAHFPASIDIVWHQDSARADECCENLGKQTLPLKFTTPASLKISRIKWMELFKQRKEKKREEMKCDIQFLEVSKARLDKAWSNLG